MANIYIIPNTTSAIQLKKIIEELGDFYYVKIVDSLENISYPDLLITAGDVAEFKDSIKELVESGVPLITLGSSSVTDQPVTYLGLSDTLSQFSSDGTKTRHTKPITSHNIWSWNNISLSTDLTLLSNGSYAQSYVPESSTFGSNVVSLACSYDSSAERTILYAPKESNLGAEVLFIGQSYLTGDGSYTQTFKNIFQASIDFLLGTQYNINGVVKTNAGVPLSRNIFVHESSTGVLSGSAKSSITDGSYTVNNLNNKEKYVVCIDDKYKSFLKSKVVPKISNKLTYSGELFTNDVGNGVAGSAIIEGGVLPYNVTDISTDGLASGLTYVLNYRTLTIDGISEEIGSFDIKLSVTDSNSNQITISQDIVITQAGNRVLLLHGDGVTDSTVLIDSSPTPKTVISSGGAKISEYINAYGGKAINYPNSGKVIVTNHADFQFVEKDWCVELDYFMTENPSAGQILFNKASGTSTPYPLQILMTTSRTITARAYNSGELLKFSIVGTTVCSINVRNTIAVSKKGNTVKLFINGNIEGTTTFTGTLNDSGDDISIGAYSTGTYSANGYIEEVRITMGYSLRDFAYTTPTGPYHN